MACDLKGNWWAIQLMTMSDADSSPHCWTITLHIRLDVPICCFVKQSQMSIRFSCGKQTVMYLIVQQDFVLNCPSISFQITSHTNLSSVWRKQILIIMLALKTRMAIYYFVLSTRHHIAQISIRESFSFLVYPSL
jgi:hypothetical protein